MRIVQHIVGRVHCTHNDRWWGELWPLRGLHGTRGLDAPPTEQTDLGYFQVLRRLPESVRLHDAMGVAANAYTYTGRTSGLLGHRAGKEGGQASDRASVWPESCQLDELAGSELEPYFVVSRLAFLQICFYLVGPAEIGRRKVGPRADPRSVTPPHRYPRRGQHGDLQLFRRTM
jgi:hypothetical protein